VRRKGRESAKEEFDCPYHHSGKLSIKPFQSPDIETITFSIFIYLICFLIYKITYSHVLYISTYIFYKHIYILT